MRTGAYVDGDGKRIATLPAEIFGGRTDSTVRRLAFGPEERYLRHLGAYISAFSVPNALGLDREELYHALPGKLTCVCRSAGDPTTKGMPAFRSPRLAYDHRDTGHQRAPLERAFAGDGWQIPRLLEAAPEADDFSFDGMQLIEMDRWSRGRVVLLGDAAHCASPASGQGTGMALVGAYVLAGELAAADGDPTAAFARYEAEMRGYVAANHALAEKFAREVTVTSRWQIRLRMLMLMLRMLPYMPRKDAVAKKIAEEVQRAAQAITLKDYPAPAARGAAVRPAATSGPRPGPRAYAA
ncbi:FAD-dependent monooxygenase [Streptomyces sp. A1-5]|uniref:FAD-dependent monooxygenase n=1 Tax=Streptomyces sp. A1-5 TaxID=2738410 RepID=UPI002E21DB23|nr:FAD-dependent monooxygenase [Streptomyces sp. A1-5]